MKKAGKLRSVAAHKIKTHLWLLNTSRAAVGGALAFCGMALASPVMAEPAAFHDFESVDGADIVFTNTDTFLNPDYSVGMRAQQYAGGSIALVNDGNLYVDGAGAVARADSDTVGSITVTNNRLLAAGFGIYANHEGAGDITVLTGANSVTSGFEGGIGLEHEGTGALNARLTGYIYSDYDAIVASHVNGGAINFQIGNAAGDQALLVAGQNGVTIKNGQESGYVDRRPEPYNPVGDTTVRSFAGSKIVGDYYGVELRQFARGDVLIDLAGDMEVGSLSDGAEFYSGACGGIYTTHYNNGDLTVNLSGSMKASLNGIGAYMSTNYADLMGEENFGDLTITVASTGSLLSQASGIHSFMYRSGDFTITNNGTIRSGDHGIEAGRGDDGLFNVRNTGTIDADGIGIKLARYSDGDIAVTNTGTITGDSVGVQIDAGYGRASLTNSGTISAGDANEAVVMYGQSIRLQNSGLINGAVTFGQYITEPVGSQVEFINEGAWIVAGSSSSLGENAVLTNTGGVSLGGVDRDGEYYSSEIVLGRFVNGGELSLVNDVLDSASITGDLSFTGRGFLSIDVARDTDFDGPQLLATDWLVVNGVFDTTNLDIRLNHLNGSLQLGDAFYLAQAESFEGTLEPIMVTAFAGFREASEQELAELYAVPLDRDHFVQGPIDGENLALVYDQLVEFSDIALTANQIATARAVAGQTSGGNVLRVMRDYGPGNEVLTQALLAVETEAEALHAFDQLSGELHPAIRTALTEDSRLSRKAVLDRLDASAQGSLWGEVFYNRGDVEATANTAQLKRNTKGFLFGVDAALSEDTVIGVAGSYLDSDLKQRKLGAKADTDTVQALAYIGTKAGALRLKAGVGYAWADVNAHRDVEFTGFEDHLEASYDASVLQGFAEAGVPIAAGAHTLEPYVQLAHVRAKTDGYAEDGDAAALNVAKATQKTTLSTLGVRVQAADAGVFTFAGMLGWQHNFGDVLPVNQHSFGAGEGFSVLGAAQSRDAAVMSAEAGVKLGKHSRVSMGYDGAFGSATTNHAAKLSFRLAF